MELGIAGVAGGALSLIFAYVPKFKQWYATKDEQTKQLIMLGLLAAGTVLIGGLNCANIVSNYLPVYSCNQAGFISLIEVFGVAVFGNIAAYQSTNYIKQ